MTIHLTATKSDDVGYPDDRPQKWHLTLGTGNNKVALSGETVVNKTDLVALAESIADPEQSVVLHVNGEEDRVLR